MTLTGPSPAPSSTPTDAPGNYTLSNLTPGGTYTVTPSKAALPPGSAGINTVDVIAAQRHYLTIALIPPGCGRDAADVNGDGTGSIRLMSLPFSDSSSAGHSGPPMLESTSSLR